MSTAPACEDGSDTPVGDGIRRFSFESFELRDGDLDIQRTWETSLFLLSTGQRLRDEFLCPLCRVPSPAIVAGGLPGCREQLACHTCGMNSRQRAGVAMLLALVPTGLVIATEQLTHTFVWLQKRLPRIEGGEYEPRQEVRDMLTQRFHQMGGAGPVRYQDVTRLSYPDGGAQAILSFDVLEHVPDYRAALAEFARVLEPGGTLIATFPFLDTPDTLTRARLLEDGSVEHLVEPEYHGDPISDGVLCFYHFGWDILRAAREAGFASARMVMPWSPTHGLHYSLWTLVCKR